MGREEIAKSCVHKLEWSFIVFKYSKTANLNFKCIFSGRVLAVMIIFWHTYRSDQVSLHLYS